MDSTESLKTAYGVITYSYCDTIDSLVTFLYFWGTDGILLTSLWDLNILKHIFTWLKSANINHIEIRANWYIGTIFSYYYMPFAGSQVLPWECQNQNQCNIYANMHRKWIW